MLIATHPAVAETSIKPSGFMTVNGSSSTTCQIAPSGNACTVLLQWTGSNVNNGNNIAITSDKPEANTIVASSTHGVLESLIVEYGRTQLFFYVNGNEIATPVSVEAVCATVPLTVWGDDTCICVNGATGDCTYCPHGQHMLLTIGGQEKCDVCLPTAPYYDSSKKRCTADIFINTGKSITTPIHSKNTMIDWISNADACVVNDIDGNYIGTGINLGPAEGGGYDYAFTLSSETRGELSFVHRKEDQSELGYAIHCANIGDLSKLAKGVKVVEVQIPTLLGWSLMSDVPGLFPSGSLYFKCEHSDSYKVINLTNKNEVIYQSLNNTNGNTLPIQSLSPEKTYEWRLKIECYSGDILGESQIAIISNARLSSAVVNPDEFTISTPASLRCGGETISLNYNVQASKGKSCRIMATSPVDGVSTPGALQAIKKTQSDLDTYINAPGLFDTEYGTLRGKVDNIRVDTTTVFNFECENPITREREILWTSIARVMCMQYR
ncbi:MAG: hypothetical protein E6Q58_04245 [Niabella sp.]|nr:MAG: hypothetical protein E6Q58_04245 [Niabella sp.]